MEPLFTDDAKDRIKETTGSILDEVQQEIEENKSKETKSGRKSKDAKQAEEAETWATILNPILTGLNTGLGKFADELKHTDEEIEVISTLGGKILPKYVDIEMMKYKDEYQLLSYLVMIETQKIQLYLASRESRKESEGNNNDSGEAGKRKNALNQNGNNSKAKQTNHNS